MEEEEKMLFLDEGEPGSSTGCEFDRSFLKYDDAVVPTIYDRHCRGCSFEYLSDKETAHYAVLGYLCSRGHHTTGNNTLILPAHLTAYSR